jgi:hypothetical protein
MRQVDIVPDAFHVAGRGGHAQKPRTGIVALKLVVADRGFQSVDGALHVGVRVTDESLALEHGRRPHAQAATVMAKEPLRPLAP